MIKKDIKKVIEISKEEYSELCRDSYKADELEWTVKEVLEDIIDIKWRLGLGVDINLDKVLEDIRDSLEYVLKEVNSEPEEED